MRRCWREAAARERNRAARKEDQRCDGCEIRDARWIRDGCEMDARWMEDARWQAVHVCSVRSERVDRKARRAGVRKKAKYRAVSNLDHHASHKPRCRALDHAFAPQVWAGGSGHRQATQGAARVLGLAPQTHAAKRDLNRVSVDPGPRYVTQTVFRLTQGRGA